MSFEYIRKTYNVQAKRGMKVKYGRPGEQRDGVITAATHYVFVRFEGQRLSSPVHPTDPWLTYLPEPDKRAKKKRGGAVLRNFNASTDARYLPEDLSIKHLVELPHAKRFRSQDAAEQFLKGHPEFTGYRAEMLP